MTINRPFSDAQRQIQREIQQFRTDLNVIEWRTRLAGGVLAQIDAILAGQCERLEQNEYAPGKRYLSDRARE